MNTVLDPIFLPQNDLKNRMWPRRVRIGRRLSRRPNVIAMIDELQNVFHTVHHLLSQTNNHHLLFAVFQHPKLRFAGQKVKHFAAVDLKVAAGNLEVQKIFNSPNFVNLD